MMRFFILLTVLGLFSACSQKDYRNVPTYSESGNLNAVVEIPAGTNQIFHYEPISNSFEPETNGMYGKRMEHLPFLVNKGFIPGTKQGKDMPAMDIFVLSEMMPTGSILEVFPIAVLYVNDGKTKKTHILANMKNPGKQIINAKNYKQLKTKYAYVIEMLEIWIKNKPPRKNEISITWGDQSQATEEIEKHTVDYSKKK